MTSAVDIANNALANIGARSSIASFQEDSPEARQCALQYDSVRLQLLRAAPWDFAQKYITMSLLKAAPGTPENQTQVTSTLWDPSYPPPGWLYSYAYPSDCVDARYVISQAGSATIGIPIFSATTSAPATTTARPARFKVTADQDQNGNPIKAICTNESQALLAYTYNVTNPDLWDYSFQLAMQDALGANLVIPLTGNLALARALTSQANDMIMQARIADGNEGITRIDSVPDWIRIRGMPSAEFEGYIAPFGPLFAMPIVA